MPHINVEKLLNMCLDKTANLLMKNFWGDLYSSDFHKGNVFSAFPPKIIETLFEIISEKRCEFNSLTAYAAVPLLISGRIQNFKMERISIDAKLLSGIFTIISVHADILQTIILDGLKVDYFGDDDHYFGDNQSLMNKQLQFSLESLLLLSPNLQHLESCIEFDLKTIGKLYSLKKLKLNFKPKAELSDMLCNLNEAYDYNNCLTHLFIKYVIDLSPNVIAHILKYCLKLQYINCNISNSLELLHKEEFFSGKLTKEYDLRQISLGSSYNINLAFECRSPEGNVIIASNTGIYIATLTCLKVIQVDLVTNDHKAICALDNLKNLSILSIFWDPEEHCDFRLSVQILLKKIGHQLNSLVLAFMENVDFQAIGILCPHLTSLKIAFISELGNFETSVSCFHNLQELYLAYYKDDNSVDEALIFILSFVSKLKLLFLNGTFNLNNIFHIVLQKNVFAELEILTLLNCIISEETLKYLISKCKNLEMISIKSSLEANTIASIVHAINPRILVNYLYNY